MARRRSDGKLIGLAGLLMMNNVSMIGRPLGEDLICRLGMLAHQDPEHFDRIAESVIAQLKADEKRNEIEQKEAEREPGELLPFVRPERRATEPGDAA
jgi:hypothetical protein